MEAKPKHRVLGHLVYFLLFAYFASRVAMSLVKLQGQRVNQTIGYFIVVLYCNIIVVLYEILLKKTPIFYHLKKKPSDQFKGVQAII
jgi:hypothetical protein